MKALRLTAAYALCAVLLFALIAFAGCSGTAPSNTFTELLNLVPAEAAESDQPVYFNLIDYASYFKENGVGTFTSIEELLNQLVDKPREILLNLPGTGNSFITGYGRYAQETTITEKYVGYNVGDVDAEIQFGTPPSEGVAAIGRFDPAATKNALSSQDEWPPEIVSLYQTEEYNGVTIHSWGDGFKMNLITRLVPPHLDELGRAMPLAVTDKYLFNHPSLEAVKLMIDASQQKAKSLADLPEYGSIAEHLGGLKIYQAIIADEAVANLCLAPLQDKDNPMTEGEKQRYISGLGTPLKKFLTCGSGRGEDEKGAFTFIVIYHENPSLARENVSRLKQHIENDISVSLGKTWGTFFTETDIRAEGNILLVRLYGESSMLWQSLIYARDNLLYHEE